LNLTGVLNEYQQGAKVAVNNQFDIHLCTPADNPKKSCLLVTAREGKNPVVDRWAFILKELAQHAERLEEEYALTKTDPNSFLNYRLGFPTLVETFKSPAGQQMMIVEFEHSEPSAMVPIARMIQKDEFRVDLKSSVWMMGKLLKILAFAHDQGISVGPITTGKILIDPDQHYVNVFDWSAGQMSTPPLTDELKQQEIAQATNVIVDALGGDVTQRTIPNNEGEEGERYIAHLWTLVDALFRDANLAHERFYQLVEKLWGRTFHPFTTFTRKGN
jgi:hypothetical protein